MKIETKYNVGDEVYFMFANMIIKKEIRDIRTITLFENRGENQEIIYYFCIEKDVLSYKEDQLFPTPIELVEDLMDNTKDITDEDYSDQ